MKKTRFLLRAPEETMQKVRELSEIERRSMNSQILIMIEKSLHKQKEV